MNLSTLQIISINSWIKNGFEFNLYTYQDVNNVPSDVNLKDPNDIIHEDKIFRYKDTGHIINGKPFGEGSFLDFQIGFKCNIIISTRWYLGRHGCGLSSTIQYSR